jgi:hypothetical protein
MRPAVRQVLADLGRRSRRLSEIDLGWRVDVSTLHRHAPELLAVKAITRRAVPGPLGLREIEMSVHLARPGVTAHQVGRLLRNNRRAGFLLSERPQGHESYEVTDRGRHAVAELGASARFERRNMASVATPIAVDDVVLRAPGAPASVGVARRPGGDLRVRHHGRPRSGVLVSATPPHIPSAPSGEIRRRTPGASTKAGQSTTEAAPQAA